MRSKSTCGASRAPAAPYDGGVSGTRPDDDPGVYRMPTEAFRVGAHAQPQDPVATPEPVPTAAPPPAAPDAATRTASARSPRRRRGWDIALTIVLVVLLAVAAVIASSLGLVMAASADACGSGGRVCRDDLHSIGVWMLFTTPLLVLAVTAFFAIVLLVVRRRAFWVPIAGTILLAALWSLGVFLVWAAT
ncbi:DUF6264 family protein [Microbacterium sp. cx-59]|nr:DUF6264 family protein [Microbacterium sp. cx-59]